MNLVVRLPIEQASNVVPIGEALKVMEFVLEHAAMQITADSNVERPCEAAHDVDAIIFAVAGHSTFWIDQSQNALGIVTFMECLSRGGTFRSGRDASTPLSMTTLPCHAVEAS